MTFTTDTSPVDCEGVTNRINLKIAKQKETILNNLAHGMVTEEKCEEVHKALDMELEEYTEFQTLKSLAVQAGVITLSEGATVYSYLGNMPDTFNNQPLEVKAVLTNFFNELLTLKIAGVI
jgi:hypothetical protein